MTAGSANGASGDPRGTIRPGQAPGRSGSGISVVLATCDRPRELGHCLRSLLGQSLQADRIVVVDDAPGGEPTPAAVRACDPDGSRVRYVEGNRTGSAGAHNRGLLEVESPLIAFTDDDVIVEPDWLQRLADAFAVAPRVGCVTGRIKPLELETTEQVWLDGYAGFDKGSERRLFDLAENRPDDPLFPFAAGAFGSGANMAFSAAALDDMRGFDAALGAGTEARGGEDLAAFFEVLVRGYTLVYEPSAVVHHRHAGDYEALRRQVYSYGVGLASYLTKCLVDHPRLLGLATRRLPRAAAHTLSSRSARNSRRPDDYPGELTRLELRGMLAGPRAYLRSRARQKRRERSISRGRVEREPTYRGSGR